MSPSQLHPNSWAIVKGFEIVCGLWGGRENEAAKVSVKRHVGIETFTFKFIL